MIDQSASSRITTRGTLFSFPPLYYYQLSHPFTSHAILRAPFSFLLSRFPYYFDTDYTDSGI